MTKKNKSSQKFNNEEKKEECYSSNNRKTMENFLEENKEIDFNKKLPRDIARSLNKSELRNYVDNKQSKEKKRQKQRSQKSGYFEDE